MKKSLYALLLNCILLVPSIYAGEINVLNQGSCWVQEKGDSIKVANFNEKNSYDLDREKLIDIFEILKKELNIKFEDITQISSHVHCSAIGARHVFKINLDGDYYCLWAKYDNSKLVKIDFDLALESEKLCDGILEDRVLVSVLKDSSIEEVVKEMEALNYKVTHFENIATNIYAIKLATKKSEIIKVVNLMQKSKNLKFIEFVRRQRPIGDFLNSDVLRFDR